MDTIYISKKSLPDYKRKDNMTRIGNILKDRRDFESAFPLVEKFLSENDGKVFGKKMQQKGLEATRIHPEKDLSCGWRGCYAVFGSGRIRFPGTYDDYELPYEVTTTSDENGRTISRVSYRPETLHKWFDSFKADTDLLEKALPKMDSVRAEVAELLEEVENITKDIPLTLISLWELPYVRIIENVLKR